MSHTFKSAILLLALILLPLSATAYDFMEGGIAYDINSDGQSVTVTYEEYPDDSNDYVSYSNASGSLTIPSTVLHNGKTYSVTKIGDLAFEGCRGFTGSLTIPNSVTYIDEGAFYGCSGFTGSLTIPNSVTEIGNFAFSGCRGFTGSLNIPNSVTTIGYSAFEGCSGFTGSLNIPNSVTEIGERAFQGCSGFTGSLNIPNSVTKIGFWAFSDCSGFTGSLNIPNSVTEIGDYAFNGCSGFTGSLNIPYSVTSIGEWAFYGCSGFTGPLNIPNSVTSIGIGAFYGCSGFTGPLNIPNSVTKIGERAFRDCSGFTGSLNIPNSVTEIGYRAFNGCSGFTGSLNIPNSVTAIGNWAFSGCSGFTGSLNIPNSVTSIGNGAFYGCSGFTGSLNIPNSVTKIGRWAFEGCSGFNGSLNIPNSVTEIGEEAFEDCSGLNSVTITGNGAWNTWLAGLNPSQIQTLKVGSEITEVGDFGLNPGVVRSYAEMPPTCAENTFSAYGAELHVPSASTVAYFTAPYWQNFTNIKNDLTEKVTLSQKEAESIAGNTLQLKATTIPASKAGEVVWSTSNPAVATVDSTGLVTLHKKGECRIFASLESDLAVYASCHVGVNSGIGLDKTKVTIAPNEILTLTPTYDPTEVNDITATTSDAAVALARVVTIDGKKQVQVVGVNYGTATITVASIDNNVLPATCTVTVRDAAAGDVNGDGKVDVEDVNAVINIILGLAASDELRAKSDVTGDGKVDVEDVNAIINLILKI